MKHVIYGLFDPRKPEAIRYVGYTSKGAERRLREHIGEARKKDTIVHRLNWLRRLSKDDVEPSIIILEEVQESNWQERERFWITQFDDLVNSTDGGEGLINPAQYVRDKISIKVIESLQGNQRLKGIPHTEASRKTISDGLRNSVKVKEENERRKGVDPHANMSDEQKAEKARKISRKLTGIKRAEFSAECKFKMSESHKGLKHTDESKIKIGISNIGNKRALGNVLSEESKFEISESKKGRRFANNGVDCVLLKKSELLPIGWQFGMLKRVK